jgi:SRSO17 transposase
MNPVWAPQREAVVSDGLVSPDGFTPRVNRLDACVVPYQHVLETEASQRHVPLSLQGLLSHVPGKNAEDIATCVDVERQGIQDCLGTVPWEQRPLATVFVGHVAARLGAPEGILAVDPSSFPKRGTPAVGGKRQWCGHRGKVDNCQVGVCMGYVSRHDHAWLDLRLSLPQEWVRDEHRRHACHVPPAVRYHTRQEPCWAMRDAWGEQVPHGWGTGDDALGRHTRFRRAWRERGARYVRGVPCTTTRRALAAPWPASQGRGRRPKAPWQSVTQWRQGREGEAWTSVTVRDGEKGPVEIERVQCRVQTRIARKRTGPAAWLVVTRRPLADAQAGEPRASQDATDQDARSR